MVQIKNNLAERGHGKSFVLSDGVFCCKVTMYHGR